MCSLRIRGVALLLEHGDGQGRAGAGAAGEPLFASGMTEGLGRFQIDDQVDLGGLLNWKI
jgi:hypothetical protein